MRRFCGSCGFCVLKKCPFEGSCKVRRLSGLFALGISRVEGKYVSYWENILKCLPFLAVRRIHSVRIARCEKVATRCF